MHRLFFTATNRPGRGLIAVPLRSCAQVTIDWSYSVLLFPVWASTTFIGWSCLPHFFVRLVVIKNKYFPHIFSIDINPMIVSIWTYLLKRRHQNSLSKRSWLFNSNGEIVALSDQQFLRLSVNLLLRVSIVFSLIRKQNWIFYSFATTAPSGPGPPHSWGFYIHTQRRTTVGRLLWTSDQPVAETSTSQHTTLTRDRHSCPGGFRTHNPSKRTAADLDLRPRGHWDRLKLNIQPISMCGLCCRSHWH